MDESLSDGCQLVEETTRSISCTDIPEALLNKSVAKKHFSQFGQIRNIILRPNQYSCTIEYETSNDAENAFLDGGTYNEEQFDISYTKNPVPKPKMAEYIDPDVQYELNAMGASSRKSAITSEMPSNRNRSDLRQSKLARQPVDSSVPAFTTSTAVVPVTTSNSSNPPVMLSSVEKATKNDLEAILRKAALTSEEKFLVLDARDKLVRLTTIKTLDIARVVSTKGVCPDMCPEKERLMREAKHQLAVFEFENGSKTVMNHLVAVKQYSRSSADQESPLPHELRPEPVLKLAMTYLLQHIMDLCDAPDTNLSDWFHFLWDRTRSIRKDITQQELCSPGSVLLVEQCARFHVHCAARLIAEEPQVFDQKINTENLTKCLQSLKYMYHDLELKMVRCPNEAEFRAYVVLLNLHDANFLWEVKQLRKEIFHSPEIRFAINVYLAMESNNYVKFFGLVRTTTYMNACILLRYFTQVRVKALNVMLKAYVARAPIYMSISYLTYILAFEDFEQCAQFLEYYGLICVRNDDRVIFDRNTFYYPDMPFILERAINVVEHKRHSTVGEAVYGSALDTKNVLENYVPHDSFDENGYLLPRAWTAEDQNFFRPEAKIAARAKTTHVPFREDDNLFKVPAAVSPRQPSPKLKHSTKSDNAPIFGGNNSSLKQFTTNNAIASDKIFKVGAKPTAKDGNKIFSGFDGFTSKNKAIENTTKNNKTASQTDNSFQNQKPKSATDITDAPSGLFKLTPSTPNAFFKATTNNDVIKSNSIFSVNFNQPTESVTNIFAQVKPTTNQPPSVFGQNQFSTQSTGIFGNFATNNIEANQQQSGNLFIQPHGFQTSSNASSSSGIFGGYKSDELLMKGILPLSSHSTENDKNNRAEQIRLEKLKNDTQELVRLKSEKAEAEQRKKIEDEKKRKLLDKKKDEMEQLSSKATIEIIDEFILSEVKKIATTEIERHQLIAHKINNIYTDLLNEVIEIELQKRASDVKEAWDKNVLDKYFTKWRSITHKSIEQRKKIEMTPMWLPMKPLPEIIPELRHPLQATTLSLMKRYRSGLPTKLITPPVCEDAIDVWSIITPELLKLFPHQKQQSTLTKTNIYWKCLISVPDAHEDNSCKTINRWLNNVFVRQLSKYPRQNDVFFAEQNIANDLNGQRINICMRKLSGQKLITESQKSYEAKDVQGTNAVLFFLTTKNLQLTRKRLETVLQTTGLQDAIGLVIYNLGTNEPLTIKTALNLHDLIDYEKIERCIFTSRSHGSLCNLTENSFQYIAANSFYDDQLAMQNTVSFLQLCLTDEFWQRIYTSINQNPTLLEAATHFDFIANYYNEALDRLISISSPCIDSHAQFPEELRKFVPNHQFDIPLDLEYFPIDWQTTSEKHQRQFNDFLSSLRIHSTPRDLSHITEASALQQVIIKFVRKHIKSTHDADRTAFKIIQQILAHLEPHGLDAIEFKEKLQKYNWLDCLPIFTIALLSFQYHQFSNQNQLPEYIIYDKDEYHEYTKTAWWLTLNETLLKKLTVDVIKNTDLEIDKLEQQRKRQRLDVSVMAEKEKNDFESILAKGHASLERADITLSNLKDTHRISKEISKDLDYSLYQQEQTFSELKNFWKRQLDD